MNAKKKKLWGKRESLREAIRRHKRCRCGGLFDAGTIGLIIKGLPAIVPVCSLQAKDIRPEDLPEGMMIVRLANH